ncbi:MAG: hypothetical protein Q4F72_03175 [Desulfovibrionaceae bacterium]|nr:hypothetical protein [Desulfovibrionaceae bacterium]
MSLFKPTPLDRQRLDDAALRADKKACIHFGPCGVGEKALYLNSFFIERSWYVPITAVRRVYKRVAMSKGGFTGKGIFGSIPYLVVEYNGGQKVCNFKHEQHVDAMLAEIKHRWPKIKTVSAAAEQKLAEAKAAEEASYKKNLSRTAKESIAALEKARAYLEERQDLAMRLAADSKARRVNLMTNPAQRWVALSIFCFAIAAAAYGIILWLTGTGDTGLYITAFGFMGIFIFSGANVLPTARNNTKTLKEALEKTQGEVGDYIAAYPDFPLPARYAHPATLARMIRSIRQGRSETVEEAFEDMKAVLKTLNSSVRVSQTEYDEVVAIKPMFLLADYR